MINNHIDVYEDGVLIDGQEVRVIEDSFFIDEPINGDTLIVAMQIVPETVTLHRTPKPKPEVHDHVHWASDPMEDAIREQYGLPPRGQAK